MLGNPLVYSNASEGMQWPSLLSTDFWGRELFPYAARCNRSHSLASHTLFRMLGDCTPEKDAQASSRHPANRPWSHLSFRPLTVASLRLDFVRSGVSRVRAAASAMHASNLAYYALCVSAAFLLFHVLYDVIRLRLGPRAEDAHLRLLALPLPLRGARPLLKPALAALVFATHTVHTEVACNVTTRADALAGALMLAACAAFLAHRARRSPAVPQWHHAASATLFALLTTAASFCKEYAVILPSLLGVCEVWLAVVDAACPPTGGEEAAPSQSPRRTARRGAPRSPARLLHRLLLPAALRGPVARDVAPAARAFSTSLRPRLPVLALLVAGQLALYILRVRLIIGRCVQERAVAPLTPAAPSRQRPTILAGHSYSLHFDKLFNPLAFRSGWLERAVGIAHTQAFATSLLFVPWRLSHAHAAFKPAASLLDPRIFLVPLIAAPLTAAIAWAAALLVREVASRARPVPSPNTSPRPGPRLALLIAFAAPFFVLTYLPASHVCRPLPDSPPCAPYARVSPRPPSLREAASPYRRLHGGRAIHAAPFRGVHPGRHRGGMGPSSAARSPQTQRLLTPALPTDGLLSPASRAHRGQGVRVGSPRTAVGHAPPPPRGVVAAAVPQGCARRDGARLLHSPPRQSRLRRGATAAPRRRLRRALSPACPRLGQRGTAGAVRLARVPGRQPAQHVWPRVRAAAPLSLSFPTPKCGAARAAGLTPSPFALLPLQLCVEESGAHCPRIQHHEKGRAHAEPAAVPHPGVAGLHAVRTPPRGGAFRWPAALAFKGPAPPSRPPLTAASPSPLLHRPRAMGGAL